MGEAYDKLAKLLGLGYPGGPVIDRLAARRAHQALRQALRAGLELSEGRGMGLGVDTTHGAHATDDRERRTLQGRKHFDPAHSRRRRLRLGSRSQQTRRSEPRANRRARSQCS